jgi:uncharacterized membrane protein
MIERGASRDMATINGPSSTGLDTNLAAALSYLAGFLSGILFLLVEKNSRFVRFHAMQSTLVFVAAFVLHVVLGILPGIGPLLSIMVLAPVSIAVWLVLMFQAFQGKKFKLPYFGDLAESKL